jgi:hypothetical protein
VDTAYFRCGVDAAYAGTTPNRHDFYQENNPRTDAFVGFFIAGYKPASAVFTSGYVLAVAMGQMISMPIIIFS